MTSTELVPRQTVTQICRARDSALTSIWEAHDALINASGKIRDVSSLLRAVMPGSNGDIGIYFERGDALNPLNIGKIQSADTFQSVARKKVDALIWGHIVSVTELDRLMDKRAKDEMRSQLQTDPPEVTVENVYATLAGFLGQSDTIFKRGIANAFSKLDRRFKSHDGFKIGSRMVLERMLDDSGTWNYHRNHRDTLIDIERAFLVLDGKSPAKPRDSKADKSGEKPYQDIVTLLEAVVRSSFKPKAATVEGDYFKVNIFKNGNAHLWFKRDDLVEKINRLLAEYYGEALGDARQQEEDPLEKRSTAVAKNDGFFPTPDKVAITAVNALDIELAYHYRNGPLRILEPSAGTGALAFRCIGDHRIVDCIEVNYRRAHSLRARGLNDVLEADFLNVRPNPIYDRVIMNPPFARGVELDHVIHALKFLKPGGRLVAILPSGVEFREDKKHVAFRKLMEEMKAEWRDLPEGSFSDVGTNVNTVLLSVRAPKQGT